MRFIIFWLLVACLFRATPVHAELEPLTLSVDHLIDDAFIENVQVWAEVPVVRLTVQDRNKTAGDIAQAEIDRLDKQWRAETKSDRQPLVASVASRPLSSYLTRIQAKSHGLYTEIFVMDKVGLNAGQSSITGDYWQGDESKFKKTYGVGKKAVFIDEPEVNEETATWRTQLNMTIHDETGEPIGAITCEVNLTELERRKLTLAN